MKFVFLLLAVFAGLVWWMLNGEPSYTDTVLAEWSVDDMTDLTDDVKEMGGNIDSTVSYDGNGSLRIEFDKPSLVTLYKPWGDGENVGFRQLVYQARVKTEHASGPVFLVMQAGVNADPDDGLPVVGIDHAISGSTDWTQLEVAAGNPANAKHFGSKLQIESRGTGLVWIDGVKLLVRQVH